MELLVALNSSTSLAPVLLRLPEIIVEVTVVAILLGVLSKAKLAKPPPVPPLFRVGVCAKLLVMVLLAIVAVVK